MPLHSAKKGVAEPALAGVAPLAEAPELAVVQPLHHRSRVASSMQRTSNSQVLPAGICSLLARLTRSPGPSEREEALALVHLAENRQGIWRGLTKMRPSMIFL